MIKVSKVSTISNCQLSILGNFCTVGHSRRDCEWPKLLQLLYLILGRSLYVNGLAVMHAFFENVMEIISSIDHYCSLKIILLETECWVTFQY